jgi:hypothetical protein
MVTELGSPGRNCTRRERGRAAASHGHDGAVRPYLPHPAVPTVGDVDRPIACHRDPGVGGDVQLRLDRRAIVTAEPSMAITRQHPEPTRPAESQHLITADIHYED